MVSIFVFLFLTSLTMIISSCIHVAANGIISFFFCGWVVFYCIYVPHLLYPFICRWTLRLFPCLGYCKQCCYEHRDACIFSNYSFVWIHAQEWDCRIIWQLYFQFSEETPYCFSQWLHQFMFPPAVQEGSLFSTPSPAFVICRL